MWLKIFLFLSLLGALVAFGIEPFNDGSELVTQEFAFGNRIGCRRQWVNDGSVFHFRQEKDIALINDYHSAFEMATNFLTEMQDAIEFGDVPTLETLFEPRFFWRDCHATHNRNETINILNEIMKGEFNTVTNVGQLEGIIYFELHVAGPNPNAIIEFNLRRADGKLVCGVSKCPRDESVGFFAPNHVNAMLMPDEEVLIRSFIVDLDATIRFNKQNISNHFSDGFYFRDCNRKYTKSEVVAFLNTVPRYAEMKKFITVIMQIQEPGKYLFGIKISGYFVTDASFVIDMASKKLDKGYVTKEFCKRSVFDLL